MGDLSNLTPHRSKKIKSVQQFVVQRRFFLETHFACFGPHPDIFFNSTILPCCRNGDIEKDLERLPECFRDSVPSSFAYHQLAFFELALSFAAKTRGNFVTNLDAMKISLFFDTCDTIHGVALYCCASMFI